MQGHRGRFRTMRHKHTAGQRFLSWLARDALVSAPHAPYRGESAAGARARSGSGRAARAHALTGCPATATGDGRPPTNTGQPPAPGRHALQAPPPVGARLRRAKHKAEQHTRRKVSNIDGALPEGKHEIVEEPSGLEQFQGSVRFVESRDSGSSGWAESWNNASWHHADDEDDDEAQPHQEQEEGLLQASPGASRSGGASRRWHPHQHGGENGATRTMHFD